MASKIKVIGEKGTFMHQVGAKQVEDQHMLDRALKEENNLSWKSSWHFPKVARLLDQS